MKPARRACSNPSTTSSRRLLGHETSSAERCGREVETESHRIDWVEQHSEMPMLDMIRTSMHRPALTEIETNRALDACRKSLASEFVERVRDKALARLDQHAAELAHQRQHVDLGKLRQALPKAKQLIEHAAALHRQQQLLMARLSGANRAGHEQMPSREEMARLLEESRQIDASLSDVKVAMALLYREVPALGALDVKNVSVEISDEALFAELSQGFTRLQENLADVRARIESKDIDVSSLSSVIEEVKADLGISERARAAGDLRSDAVLSWLEEQQRAEAAIAWTATGGAIVLGVAAFFATGGLAAVLGVLGAGAGFAHAAYELERADDIYDASRTSLKSEDALADRDAAQFQYVLGCANLVIAALDLGVAGLGLKTSAKAASIVDRFAGADGAGALAKLDPKQIVALDRALKARATGDVQQAEAILDRLRKELGAEVLAEASAFFDRAVSTYRRLGKTVSLQEIAKLHDELGDEAFLAAAQGLSGRELISLRERLGAVALSRLARGSTGLQIAKLEKMIGAEAAAALADAGNASTLLKVDAAKLRMLAATPERAGELIRRFDPRVLNKVEIDALEAVERVVGTDAAARLAIGLDRKAFAKVAAELADPATKQALKSLDPVAVLRLIENGVSPAALGELLVSGDALSAGAGRDAVLKLANEKGDGFQAALEAVRTETKRVAGGGRSLLADLSIMELAKVHSVIGAETTELLARTLTGPQIKSLLGKLRPEVVRDLARALGGRGLEELSTLGMFSFDPTVEALIAAGRGSAARSLPKLAGLRAGEVRNLLKSYGFQHAATERGMEMWTHADGSIVRLKAADGARADRPGRHAVLEISRTPGQFGRNDILAKVTAEGRPIPAGSNHAEQQLKIWLQGQLGRAPTQRELDAAMDVWADAAHVSVRR